MLRVPAVFLIAASCAVTALPAAARANGTTLAAVASPTTAMLGARFLVAFAAKGMAAVQLLNRATSVTISR